MEDYTKEDVINALSKIPKKLRKRSLVDQRSYLIGLLAFRFMMTEHGIAAATGHNRHTVNHNKKLVLQYYDDKEYMQNVFVHSVCFPFDFSVIKKIPRTPRKIKMKMELDKKTYTKLKAIGSILGHNDARDTIKLFIENGLKLWEK